MTTTSQTRIPGWLRLMPAIPHTSLRDCVPMCAVFPHRVNASFPIVRAIVVHVEHHREVRFHDGTRFDPNVPYEWRVDLNDDIGFGFALRLVRLRRRDVYENHGLIWLADKWLKGCVSEADRVALATACLEAFHAQP